MDKLVRLSYIGKSAAEAVASTGAQAAGAVAEKWEGFGDYFNKKCDKLNIWAAGNRIGRGFQFKERNAKLTVEIRAGVITFFVVAYILAVNPSILATTGGTCNPEVDCTDYASEGRQCLLNPEDPLAVRCMENLKMNLVTATAASSLISTFLVGYFANLPLALAPGLGINAYIAYQVVGPAGSGELSYQQAMAAIFIESWIFLILSVTGVRGGIVKYMPKCIAIASTVGIGLLLAFTGLRSLGVVVFDPSTLVSLGGCSAEHRTYVYAFDEPLHGSLPNNTLVTLATVYGCASNQMRSATMWLGIGGGILMAFLLFVGVKGAVITGMAFVTIISWIPGHSASYLGVSSPIPGGQSRLQVFKQIVAAPTLDMTGLAWDWSAFTKGHLWIALFTFLYIDLLDCTGTLLSMAQVIDNMMPGFIDEHYEFPGQMWAYLSDGVGIMTGSMMGTSPLTVFLESAAGIEDGGRTGVTAIVVAFFFFVSLFFSPIFASIPPYATGPALVLVGCILLGHVGHIKWDDIGDGIPAFLTIIMMPFTYSVAYGVIAGLAAYIAIHTPAWVLHWYQKWRARGDPGAGSRDGRSSHRSRQRQLHRKVFGGNASMVSRGGSDGGSHQGDGSMRGGRNLGDGGSFSGYDNSFHGGSLYSYQGNGIPIPQAVLQPGGLSTELVGRSPPYGRSPSVSAHGGLPFLSHLQRASGPGSMVQGPGGEGMAGQSLANYRKGLNFSPGRPTRDQYGRAISTPVEVLGGPRGAKGLPLGGGLTRSRTFTSGFDSLGPGANLRLEPGASSPLKDRPGSFLFMPGSEPQQEFKLFGDVGPLSAPQQEFKLFGDVGPLSEPQREFKLFGDVEPLEEAPQREFKLFGDVELPSGAEAAPQQQQQQQQQLKLFPDVEPVSGPTAQPGGPARPSPFLQARRSVDLGEQPGVGRQASPGATAASGSRAGGLPVAPLTDVVVSKVGEESPQASVVHWLEQASLTPLGSAASGRVPGGRSPRPAAARAGRSSRSPSPAERPNRPPPVPPSAPPEDGNE